ncbi:NADPH-dependent FMN reductase [Bacillus sp. 1P06AnD]|uniref:NADPH-dependent FMN reductase n=1 Tax=Bacillus sp. 1P06AnD TaxID=3132208 RepID=UPI0039A175E7
MKIAAIVGSNRKDSYNMKLTKFVQKTYADKFDMEILMVNDLPFYNEDTEHALPAPVVAFINKVKEADAILWVTPEYNYSIPGVLKNAIDWLSRGEKVLIGKPSWIIGASMGTMGTVRAQLHLRDILFSPGVSSPLLPGNEFYVGQVHEKVNAEGELIHEPTLAFLNVVVDNFINWYNQHTRA